MYLLYLDESGNESDPNDQYFVLAGIALFERQTYFLSEAVEAIQNKHFPNHQPIQFHTTDIRAGNKFWRKVSKETRQAVIKDLVDAIANSPDPGRLLYAAAVEKDATLWKEQAVEAATEQICKRFDRFLQLKYQEKRDPQRGLLVFAEGRFDKRAKVWVQNFRQRGTAWGAITNLADIPYFASMAESRLLQLADLVAHAVWLLYEKRNPDLIRPLLQYFDSSDGILHGLVHVGASHGSTCDCPACVSRHKPGSVGNWAENA